MMALHEVKLIDFPRILDERGNLSFFQSNDQIPFNIKRVYWVYDVPGGELRGGHAFKTQHEVIVALSGSFDVVVDDGNNKKVFSLRRSYHGLYIPNLMWRHLENFSTNSLALVVSDCVFDETEYIRDFSTFNQVVTNASHSI